MEHFWRPVSCFETHKRHLFVRSPKGMQSNYFREKSVFWAIIGLDNGLLPSQRQYITRI